MENCYVNYSCVDGSCPRLIEERIYGISSPCSCYCGEGFHGCETCYFEQSDICNNCIYKDKLPKL